MIDNGRKTELRRLLFIPSLCLFIAPSLAWGDYQDGRKAYNRGDYATALKELRPLAEQGHAEAQYLLGYMYYKGRGVGQDGEATVKWLRKAAEQGDVKAQYLLGYMYYKGQSIGQDSEEAQKWLRKAAEQGHAKAQFYLGEMYYKVRTVGQDEEEAVKWVHKAAEQDYDQAQHILPMLLNETQVDSDPEKNFQILWNEFDRHYVFFLSKNVNWQALYDIYAPQVTDQTDNSELFDILSSMLTHLNDVHVTLTMPFKNFNSANRRPEGILNLDLVKSKYLNAGFQTTGDGFFTSGQISDAIGYLHIASFSIRNGSAWVEAIDPIVNEFFDHKGLIVDVRGNNGGSSRNVDAIVGRFADQKRVSALVQRRDGSRHSDFGRIIKKYVKPAGDKQFTKSIIVLTDRQVISSGEYFVLAMKQFPYVRTVGDTTFGGQGSPTRKKLPNGWEYRVSTGKWSSADYVLYEDIGVPPD
ncbi:MAG: hypothetical protein F4215_11960, partial [Gemmatimonadetes bacterium]|nr:hypothetical protein [Gemmatimonadota bacterium]